MIISYSKPKVPAPTLYRCLKFEKEFPHLFGECCLPYLGYRDFARINPNYRTFTECLLWIISKKTKVQTLFLRKSSGRKRVRSDKQIREEAIKSAGLWVVRKINF